MPKPRCGPTDWQPYEAAATCPTSWRDASCAACRPVEALHGGEWNELLRVRGMPPERDGPESAAPLTRAEAARLVYRLLAR